MSFRLIRTSTVPTWQVQVSNKLQQLHLSSFGHRSTRIAVSPQIGRIRQISTRNQTQDFLGKVAFVTGGASGIGRATCEILASRGASVAITDIRGDAAQRAADEIRQKHGVSTLGLVCDVAEWNQVEGAVRETVEALGGLHCALNAAGLPAWLGSDRPRLADTTIKDWHRMVDVNCNGVFHSVKAQIQHFQRASTKGAIVNVASTTAKRPVYLGSAYSTSKHAVWGITQTASLEYAREGIRTNAVAPGYTHTPMLEKAGDVQDADYHHQVPMGRVAQPEEIGEVIAFLLSEKASYVSGAFYLVDGGWMNTPPGATEWIGS